MVLSNVAPTVASDNSQLLGCIGHWPSLEGADRKTGNDRGVCHPSIVIGSPVRRTNTTFATPDNANVRAGTTNGAGEFSGASLSWPRR